MRLHAVLALVFGPVWGVWLVLPCMVGAVALVVWVWGCFLRTT